MDFLLNLVKQWKFQIIYEQLGLFSLRCLVSYKESKIGPSVVKALLHCAFFGATYLATPLGDKLHKSLLSATYLATATNVVSPVAETVAESTVELNSTFRNGCNECFKQCAL